MALESWRSYIMISTNQSKAWVDLDQWEWTILAGRDWEELTLFSFCQMMKAGVRSPLVTLQVSSSLECLSTTRPVSLPSISVIESEQNIIIVLLTKYFSSIYNFQYSNKTTILLNINLPLQKALCRSENMFELKYISIYLLIHFKKSQFPNAHLAPRSRQS